MVKIFGNFLHGADYNPDQWLDYPEIFERDLELMKKAKCNVMAVGIFSWATLEPEEGVFNFEWLDNVINRLNENGIKTILATPSGARPAWMSHKYPEVLRVSNLKVRNMHGFRHNHCYTSPVYREKTAIINGKLAERYANNDAIIMWHISNEFGGDCHCDLCQRDFRLWLKDKYKTLENLNKKWWSNFWSHTYTSWDQIESPSPIGENQVHALNIDWKRFVTYKTIDFMKHEINVVKKYNPNIPATTNFQHYFEGLNYFKFKDEMDLVSFDCYPEWHSEDNVKEGYKTSAFYDVMRSIKKQPFVLMENTPSMTNWQRVSKLKKPGMHKLSAMQVVAHGSDTVQYFQWRKGRGSSEKLHGAVVDHYGKEDNRVFRDVSEVGEVLEQITPIVGARTKAKVAIVYDWENMWALNDSQGPRNIGLDYNEVMLEYYRVFWEKGINVDFVDMECEIKDYDLVVAPLLYMLRENYGEVIRDYVNGGGNFVTTYFSGIVDDTDLCYLGGFPGGLMDVFGVRSEEVDALFDHQSNTIKMKDKEYVCKDICDILELQGAKVLAEYTSDFFKGRPALTCNEYGQGKAYYIAARNEHEFNKEFFNDIINELNIEKNLDVELPHGVTVTMRESEDKKYLFIQNFSDDERTVELDKTYRNVLTNEEVSGSLTLKAYGVEILTTDI